MILITLSIACPILYAVNYLVTNDVKLSILISMTGLFLALSIGLLF